MMINMAVKKSQLLESSALGNEHEVHPDTREDSLSHEREDGEFAKGEDVDDIERLGNSGESISSAAAKYTLQEIEILTAVSNAPSPRLTQSSTVARRFITIVGPPAPAAETNKPETSTPPANQPGQQVPGKTGQQPQPSAQPGIGLVPVPPAAQPSTLFPSVAAPSTTTTPSAQKSAQSPTPTSQSKSAQQSPSPAQSDASRSSSSRQNLSTSSRPTRSLETSLSLVQPSQQPEKQPDSAPAPVSSPPGLSRGAEVGIVIGSIALAAFILCTAIFYYYRRKPSADNIFTSRNKNLVPQRSISRPFPQDDSASSPTEEMQQTSFIRRPAPPAPVVVMAPVPVVAERRYPRTERPLPPLPTRQSLIGRGSNSYNRLP